MGINIIRIVYWKDPGWDKSFGIQFPWDVILIFPGDYSIL